eukprot:2287918-Pyramimonas_sp.AAC.1
MRRALFNASLKDGLCSSSLGVLPTRAVMISPEGDDWHRDRFQNAGRARQGYSWTANAWNANEWNAQLRPHMRFTCNLPQVLQQLTEMLRRLAMFGLPGRLVRRATRRVS